MIFYTTLFNDSGKAFHCLEWHSNGVEPNIGMVTVYKGDRYEITKIDKVVMHAKLINKGG